jgi:hypothetical protein
MAEGLSELMQPKESKAGLPGSVKDVDDGFIGNRLALGSRYQCHRLITVNR